MTMIPNPATGLAIVQSPRARICIQDLRIPAMRQGSRRQYTATLAMNVRVFKTTLPFDAVDDEAARKHAIESVNWDRVSDDLCPDLCDHQDRVVTVQRINSDLSFGSEAGDAIELDEDRPYSGEATHIVRQLAELKVENLEQIKQLVRDARRACGLAIEIDSEEASS